MKYTKNTTKNYYRRRHQNDDEEIQAENDVENEFDVLKCLAKVTQAQEISMNELDKVVNDLQNSKAPDKSGMRNEFIKYGGKDLRQSLLILLNEIMEKGDIPNKWKSMRIKSLYKKKGDRREMENQRGIFLTNIVSKVFERIILNRNRNVIEKYMSAFQCGGKKGRSTIDHLFQLRAVMDEYRYKNRDLHVFYGDLQKCFDKLWLKDCIVKLSKSGMNLRELMLVHSLNEEAIIYVQTPYEETKMFRAKEIVRQGTIWGPTLCAIVTDKVNSIHTTVKEKYGDEDVEPMIYPCK